MYMPHLPFEAIDWSSVEPTTHPGEQGVARWRTRHAGEIRVRIVDYSPGYVADHWCEKGHVLFCLEGELRTQLKNGQMVILRPGMSYQVGDGSQAHRSSSPDGAKLFIVD